MMVANFGTKIRLTISQFGSSTYLLFKIILTTHLVFKRPRHFLWQVYQLGVLSLPIIIVAGGFVGLVMGLQSYYVLVNFSAEEQTGVSVALALTRELGPVITALLFIGRACSAITAEIGLMKSTEQLDALEMMALDPISWVLLPRFLAAMLVVPLLICIFNAIGILGGYVIVVSVLGVDTGAYWSNIIASVSFSLDVVNGLIKGVFFAFVSIWIALTQGYLSYPSAQGLAQATTKTVVYGSLIVLAVDFLLTAIMFQ